MKVANLHTGARAEQLCQRGQREAASEEVARRFQKLLQRRRKEEDESMPGAGPLDLVARLEDWQEDPSQITSAGLLAQNQVPPDRVFPQAPELSARTDPEVIQLHMQDSLRLDTMARAAMEAGTKAAMAQGGGEYQVELGSAFFTRTRLRVRAGERTGFTVRCESDSASEREWFARHRDELASRIGILTGRSVQVDVVGIGT
jgi:hypothetical protein